MFASRIISICFLFYRAMKKLRVYVHSRRVTFMQRIADRVKDGYFECIYGFCARDKYSSLVAKFSVVYDLDISKDQRYRKKKCGEAVFSLISCLSDSGEASDIYWILLRTAGRAPLLADKKEVWVDVRHSKLIVFGRYELHRHTRKDMPAPSWSWRIEKIKYSNLREDVVLCIRRKFDKKLAEHLHDLALMPKFAPIRKQISDIHKLVESEFRRSRSTSDKVPDFPRIGYARRLKDKMISI